MNRLFTPFTAGDLQLSNRMVMAPLTRGRTGPDRIPNDLMIEYYRQRATAGLIISEATIISEQAAGWINTPGLYNEEQVRGWKRVTDAVHAAGGKIIVQLWHMGRSSHVPELDNNFAAGRMDRVGDPFPSLHLLLVVETRGIDPTGRLLGDDCGFAND